MHNNSPLSLFGVVECVLQTAGPPGYVGIIWVVVSLTNNVDAPKAKVVIHVGLALPLDVYTVKTTIVALDDLKIEGNQHGNILFYILLLASTIDIPSLLLNSSCLTISYYFLITCGLNAP